MKHLLISLLAIALCACHHIDEWDDTAAGNFDALWTAMDQHYCFFEQKGVDWDSCHSAYSKRLYAGMSSTQLFAVCADMLDELRDGHVNLIAGFNTSYYTKWWSDYPQNYDERLVRQYYLGFDALQIGAVRYAILPENIGYISYPSFETALSDNHIDHILNHFALCNGIIIDIRNNGGGMLTASERLARHFYTQRSLIGYIINKTGPGHSDFSAPFEQYISPAADGHFIWDKPVAVLTNRSTFSAANNFASVMQQLPNCLLVGATTGGGSGMPMSLELPNGWGLRFSSVSILDAKMRSTEAGIAPDIAADLDPELALQGTDTMIEAAIAALKSFQPL